MPFLRIRKRIPRIYGGFLPKGRKSLLQKGKILCKVYLLYTYTFPSKAFSGAQEAGNGWKYKKRIDNCVYCVYTVNIRYVQPERKRGNSMEIYISNSSGVPIYAQITDQIRTKILSGELQEGDALPSIRLLAKELRISVIPTKRAYEDLERAGLIHTLPGKGSFVAPQDPQMHREEALRQVEAALTQAIDAARLGGITADEVRQTLDLLLEGE